MAKKKAAVCIIEDQHGRILLLQRSNIPHGFYLPGGKMDPGETPLMAAMREVLEETGIHIKLTEYDELGVVNSAVNDFEVHVYGHVLMTPETVVLSDEHVGYTWTAKPFDGIYLAGNTDKMIELNTNY